MLKITTQAQNCKHSTVVTDFNAYTIKKFNFNINIVTTYYN